MMSASTDSLPQKNLQFHTHVFDDGNPLAQRNTKRAVILTAVMMVIEITAGYAFGSMALLADGWHMSSHVLALGLALLAYIFARKYAADSRFAFGTWKIEILGGYTSAILLVLVALAMLVQSVQRIVEPLPIHYNEAIAVGILGLLVNVVCAWLLKGGEHGHHHHHGAAHEHHHHHEHQHDHGGQDLNLRSAYMHVIADAATSVLAIVALVCGKFWGADWLDPVMGIVGAMLITFWAIGLIRASGRVLLDAEMDAPVVDEIREVIEKDAKDLQLQIGDLHVWRVGKDKYACIVGIVTASDITPQDVRRMLSVHEELVHITVEINRPQHGAGSDGKNERYAG